MIRRPIPESLPLLLLAFGGSVIAAIGCDRRDPVTTPSTKPSRPASQVGADTLLESAIEILQAKERSQASHQIAAQRLNQYLEQSHKTGQDLVAPLDPQVRQSLAGFLSAQQLERIQQDQFDRPDADHLDTCFLQRDIVQHVTEGLRDELARVEAVFDWVIRNVQLSPADHSSSSPIAPRAALVLGRGTELERGWTFIELLRQLGLEGVWVAYRVTDPETRRQGYVAWVPAALIGESLYLFDTALGLPVPGPGGKGIATLRDVQAKPDLLDALEPDADRPYRVRGEQLEQIALLLDSTPTYWAPRMQFLQDRLSGRNRAVLWSDLADLVTRLRSAMGESIIVDLWPVAAQVDEATRSRPEYREELQRVLTPYLLFSPTLNARFAHLRGKFSDAIPIYMDVRIAPEAAFQDRPEALALYKWIREDSTYFLGVLKFEQRQYEPATKWLANSYLEHYPEGKWASGARYLLGRCAEAQNDREGAISYYTIPDATAQGVGNLIRARRLGWVPEPAAAETSPAPVPPSE
jgi:hypothetical protein